MGSEWTGTIFWGWSTDSWAFQFHGPRRRRGAGKIWACCPKNGAFPIHSQRVAAGNKSCHRRLRSLGTSRSRRTSRVWRKQGGPIVESRVECWILQTACERIQWAPKHWRTTKNTGGLFWNGAGEGIRHHQHGHSGLAGHSLPRVLVPGRGGPQCCKLLGGIGDVSCAGMQGPFNLTEGTTIHEGVAKIMPTTQQDAYPTGGNSTVGGVSNSSEATSDSFGVVADVFPIPTTGGGLQASSAGHCSTSEKGREGVQILFSPPSPNRTGHSIKDLAVGRDAHLGFSGAQLFGASVSANLGVRPPPKAKQSLHSHPRPSERVHEGQLAFCGFEPFGGTSHVPPQARGGLIRSGQSVETNVRDTKQRSVANNEEPAKLRKGEQTVPAIRQPRQKGAKSRASGSKASSKNVPVGALSKEAWLVVPVFLEIFSGTGRLGKSISRICGWPVLLWDIDLGEHYDLCSRANQQRIIHWIQSGMVRGGHLGTPCGSFSRARDRPGGPPQLRSDSCPLGLQGLRPADSKKVAIGNLLMRFTVRVLLLALQLGLAFTVENPQKSRLWLCPPFRRLLRRRFVQQQDVEFCAFGTQWKKSTRFVSTHLVLDNLAPYRCHGAKRGLCAFTGKPHLPLMGQNSSGVWLTKIAEPYPWKLTHVVAKAFLNSDLADIANSFSQYLTWYGFTSGLQASLGKFGRRLVGLLSLIILWSHHHLLFKRLMVGWEHRSYHLLAKEWKICGIISVSNMFDESTGFIDSAAPHHSQVPLPPATTCGVGGGAWLAY